MLGGSSSRSKARRNRRSTRRRPHRGASGAGQLTRQARGRHGREGAREPQHGYESVSIRLCERRTEVAGCAARVEVRAGIQPRELPRGPAARCALPQPQPRGPVTVACAAGHQNPFAATRTSNRRMSGDHATPGLLLGGRSSSREAPRSFACSPHLRRRGLSALRPGEGSPPGCLGGASPGAGRKDDDGADLGLCLGRDVPAHEGEQVGGEERVEGEVVDAEGLPSVDADVAKACPLEFRDEVTLRQGAGHSTGPGGRVREDLGRKLVLLHGDVGDGEPAAGA